VRLILAAVLMLMLSSMAMAIPEPQQLGPFNVSFDIKTNLDHTIQIAQPMQTDLGNTYQMRIFTDNSTNAIISINKYKDLTDATLSTGKQIMSMGMFIQGLNVTKPEDKMIDGKKGFVIMGTPFTAEGAKPSDIKIYRAVYWLDSKECGCGDLAAGTTNVVITSSYPEDVTMNLLDSIKIEKTGDTTAKVSSSDMPPSQ
jgi:hypothetical protein